MVNREGVVDRMTSYEVFVNTKTALATFAMDGIRVIQKLRRLDASARLIFRIIDGVPPR